jgi:hypothetical protein
MQSSIIGKIEKAKRYATEPSRVTFNEFSLTFRGDNDTHAVTWQGRWHCTCDFFADHNLCCHTMALEQLLEGMLPVEAHSTMMARA